MRGAERQWSPAPAVQWRACLWSGGIRHRQSQLPVQRRLPPRAKTTVLLVATVKGKSAAVSVRCSLIRIVIVF